MKHSIPAETYSIVSYKKTNKDGINYDHHFHICLSHEDEVGILVIVLFDKDVDSDSIRVNGIPFHG